MLLFLIILIICNETEIQYAVGKYITSVNIVPEVNENMLKASLMDIQISNFPFIYKITAITSGVKDGKTLNLAFCQYPSFHFFILHIFDLFTSMRRATDKCVNNFRDNCHNEAFRTNVVEYVYLENIIGIAEVYLHISSSIILYSFFF